LRPVFGDLREAARRHVVADFDHDHPLVTVKRKRSL
jgi:hypothetical protein